MKYKAVIFDFDYTLGDATKGIEISVNYALTQLGYKPGKTEEIRKTIGLSLKDTYIFLTGNKDEERVKMFVGYFRQKADEVMVENTELYLPTKEVLNTLKEKGCKIGIVTTKFHYRIDQILSKFDMNGVVDIIVGTEDVKEEKPNPEGLLLAIELFNLEKQNVLYVGDSIVDAKTADWAQVDFAGVLTGTTGLDDFNKWKHILIAEDLYRILEIME